MSILNSLLNYFRSIIKESEIIAHTLKYESNLGDKYTDTLDIDLNHHLHMVAIVFQFRIAPNKQKQVETLRSKTLWVQLEITIQLQGVHHACMYTCRVMDRSFACTKSNELRKIRRNKGKVVVEVFVL